MTLTHVTSSARSGTSRWPRWPERFSCRVQVLAGLVAGALATTAYAQDTGIVRGAVTFTDGGAPVHSAVVLVVGPSLVTLTDENGAFEIPDVPAGTYEVLAQREHLTAARQTITVRAGDAVVVDFKLELTAIHEELTVTATAGGQTTAFEAFNAISTLDSFDLVTNAQGSLGEALQHLPGVANRSFGPGASRPIIRGFDGDRVLLMEDGIRSGDLSSQSGDHGVTIDPNGLERVEIVRGPATLLYGSNAVGGVVNAITPHESQRDSQILGTQGQFGADTGSANAQVGTNASVQHATGRVLVWAGGGTRRSGDYATPDGTIPNSATRLSSGRAGIGYLGDRLFASGGVQLEDSRHGVPFAGVFHGDAGDGAAAGEAVEDDETVRVNLESRRRVGRFDAGMRNLTNGVLDGFRVVFNVIDYQHTELETAAGVEDVGTVFDNRAYVLRAEVSQRQTATLAGKFGVWSKVRQYVATGAEALAPPTDQTALAAFAYEELDFGRYRVQFGGRVERNAYTVDPRAEGGAAGAGGHDPVEPPDVRDRSFTGASASVGLQVDLGEHVALVANVTRSYRAPALEELYNFGPHVGNLVFEVGNPDLEREATIGLDLSLRHQARRFRGSVNAYRYDIDNFVFAAVRDVEIDGLRVAPFLQANSRFVGFEVSTSVQLVDTIWVTLGLGMVDATLRDTNERLPRIPPLRGQVSVDIPYRGFTVSPEWIVAAAQDQVFRNETATDGYSLFNLKGSYVWPRQHQVHILSVTGYNLTDELYRSHTSFIKDLAPEIGRGVKLAYSVRFF